MADSREIEERLKNLEDRTKESFLALEKKFASLESSMAGKGDAEIVDKEPAGSGELAERIQELEDLLLLIEMENTKIKEKVIGSANAETPVDVLTRLQKLEEKVAVAKESGTEGIEKKIEDLENYVGTEMAQFDKRLARLEEEMLHQPVKGIEMKKAVETPPREYRQINILEEVQKILEG